MRIAILAQAIVTAVVFAIPFGDLAAQTPTPAAAQPTAGYRVIPADVTARYLRLQPHLQATAKQWVEAQTRLERKRPTPNVPALDSAVRKRFGNTGPSGSTEAMTFIVLTQSLRDDDQDLQNQMANVQALTDAKEQARALLDDIQKELFGETGRDRNTLCVSPLCQSLNDRLAKVATSARKARYHLQTALFGRLTYQRLGEIETELAGDVNDMNDLGDNEAQQLQMTMDRRSKLIDALSNVLKTISDTDDSVVENLK